MAFKVLGFRPTVWAGQLRWRGVDDRFVLKIRIGQTLRDSTDGNLHFRYKQEHIQKSNENVWHLRGNWVWTSPQAWSGAIWANRVSISNLRPPAALAISFRYCQTWKETNVFTSVYTNVYLLARLSILKSARLVEVSIRNLPNSCIMGIEPHRKVPIFPSHRPLTSQLHVAVSIFKSEWNR
jgi:hypothetical protein